MQHKPWKQNFITSEEGAELALRYLQASELLVSKPRIPGLKIEAKYNSMLGPIAFIVKGLRNNETVAGGRAIEIVPNSGDGTWEAVLQAWNDAVVSDDPRLSRYQNPSRQSIFMYGALRFSSIGPAESEMYNLLRTFYRSKRDRWRKQHAPL